MRRVVILGLPLLLLACTRGAVNTNNVPTPPRPIVAAPAQPLPKRATNIQFSVTTAAQEKSGGLSLSIGNLNSPNVGMTSRPGAKIESGKGFVFLLVKADVSPMAGRSMTGGTDFYLTDGSGEKKAGFYRNPVLGWLSEATSFSYTSSETRAEEFLYPVRADRVVGSVFHFLDSDATVTEYPPKVAQ